MDVTAYLKRINYSGPLTPTLQTLTDLQQAHILNIPFENLNIHLGVPITTDVPSLFAKIVQQKRGGFCYELNGLFAALLQEIGFAVQLLAAQVRRPDGEFGLPFDHLTLLVTLDQPYLVDVGFGDSPRQPMPLVPLREFEQFGQLFRLFLADDGKNWFLQQKDGDEWKARHTFTLQPYQMADFSPMCHYHQTSPESGFSTRWLCTLGTPDGRITLAQANLIVTDKGERHETPVANAAEYLAHLQHYFGIDLSSYQAKIASWPILAASA